MEDTVGCRVTRHMWKEDDFDGSFEDDVDDLDGVWMFSIGGQWADHYAKEATHQLDECMRTTAAI